LGSPPSARCSHSQRQPSAPTRFRSAIPAPPRRFRKTPGWRQRKCIGGTTIITITVGIAGTIIIATIITVTGAIGKSDNSALISHRPASLRACFRFSCALKLARLLRVSDGLDQREESVMKSLIGAAVIAGALAVAGPAAISPAAAAPQAKAQSAGTSDATDFSAHRYVRRHYRHDGYYRPYYRSYYYDRPVYYRPYPYSVPAPFTFGIGFGPAWW
jgi:hypothetical protein